MRRFLAQVILVVACDKHAPTLDASGSAAPLTSSSASASIEEEEEVPVAVPQGPCPGSVSPGYCRRCRTFDDRMRTHHAKRIRNPSRVGYGTCGADTVFAEDDRAADAGIVEWFGDAGTLVAARDARNAGCKDFGAVPTCTPDILWSSESDGGVDQWPSVRFGDVTSTSLPREVIQRIVRQMHRALLNCYLTALHKTPSLSGKVTVAFSVDAAGNAKDVKDAGSTLPDAAVIACIIPRFEAMGFPTPAKPPEPIKITLELARGRLENPLLNF